MLHLLIGCCRRCRSVLIEFARTNSISSQCENKTHVHVLVVLISVGKDEGVEQFYDTLYTVGLTVRQVKIGPDQQRSDVVGKFEVEGTNAN